MNHKKKGICFFDLDGTLLDNWANCIPKSAGKALELLRVNYHIVLSTGRDMDTHYSMRYRDMVMPDAIIHLNGNKITVGNQLLFRHTVDRELLREVYEYCLERGYCIGTSVGDEDFFIYPEKKVKSDLSYKRKSERNFVPFEEVFRRNVEVTALSYAGDLDKEKPVLERRFPMLELLAFNSGTGADVVERGYSKAEGLRKMCAYYDISEEQTYAFGDSPNDISLLQAAEVGIAMGNADQSVKDIADYVTDDVDKNGIYNACKHFGMI